MKKPGKETLLTRLGLICIKCEQEREIIIDKSKIVLMPVLESGDKVVIRPRHPANRHPYLCRYHRQELEESYGKVGKAS